MRLCPLCLVVGLGLAAAAPLAFLRSAAPTVAQVSMQQPAEGNRGQDGRANSERGERGERRVSVEGSMKAIQRSFEALERQIGDPGKRDENLKLINEAQRGCVLSKGAGLPREIAEKNLFLDAASKARMHDDYRVHLVATLRKLIDLEEAVAAGKTEDAKAALAAVAKLRDEGHNAMGMHE
ncbi:MAG TPA: hypothetical protein VF777_14235 [Phycisphaerales bacterium]